MPRRGLRIGIDGRELVGHPTGVGRYLRSLLRRFVKHPDHRFVVFAPSPVALPAASDRLEVRVLGGGVSLGFEQRMLPAALRREGIDVLLAPAYSCPLLTKVPRVTALHDLSFFARREEFGFLHGLRRRVMARGSASVSRSLLACSQFTRAEVQRHLGTSAALKTAVVLLGPDDDLPAGPPRSEARAALGLADASPLIVTVGTVLRRRGVSTLVRAFADVRRAHPTARLAIVGENRSHPFEDIAAVARESGVSDAVTLTGFVDDARVATFYAAADAAVFLSDYEGFGLPALEAMSRGVPTIVADRGSLNEISGPGAVVVEPSQEAVGEALGRVLKDPSLAQSLRARGRERASSFSWDVTAAGTLQVLEAAAPLRPAPLRLAE